MKRIFIVAALLLAVSSACMAQSEEEEGNLFGYTRSISSCKKVNVGSVGKDVVKVVYEVDNETNKVMKIVGFTLPAGISAMSMQKSIEEFEKGKVQICIDPLVAERVSGEMISINVVYIERNGKETKDSIPLKLVATE